MNDKTESPKSWSKVSCRISFEHRMLLFRVPAQNHFFFFFFYWLVDYCNYCIEPASGRVPKSLSRKVLPWIKQIHSSTLFSFIFFWIHYKPTVLYSPYGLHKLSIYYMLCYDPDTSILSFYDGSKAKSLLKISVTNVEIYIYFNFSVPRTSTGIL
jgi:hypothetical protein